MPRSPAASDGSADRAAAPARRRQSFGAPLAVRVSLEEQLATDRTGLDNGPGRQGLGTPCPAMSTSERGHIDGSGRSPSRQRTTFGARAVAFGATSSAGSPKTRYPLRRAHDVEVFFYDLVLRRPDAGKGAEVERPLLRLASRQHADPRFSVDVTSGFEALRRRRALARPRLRRLHGGLAPPSTAHCIGYSVPRPHLARVSSCREELARRARPSAYAFLVVQTTPAIAIWNALRRPTSSSPKLEQTSTGRSVGSSNRRRSRRGSSRCSRTPVDPDCTPRTARSRGSLLRCR